MNLYTSFSPEVQVDGRTVDGFLSCINSEEVAPFLEKHGIEAVNVEEWYALEDLLEVLRDIDQNEGAMMRMVSIGLAAADAVSDPRNAGAPLEAILERYDLLHQRLHRGGDVGSYEVEFVEPKHAVLLANLPYPRDLIYGMVYGVARRYAPEGSDFSVWYEDAPDQTEDHFMIHVRWA